MFNDRPSRDIAGLLLASVERECCSCLMANRRSVIAGSRPDAEGVKATLTSSILRWQQRINRGNSRFEVENGVRIVWLLAGTMLLREGLEDHGGSEHLSVSSSETGILE
jgi:hypothetical protein